MLDEYEIATTDDLAEALRIIDAEAERVVLVRDGRPVAAIIPLIDLRLLLKLEDDELDRMVGEDLRRQDENPEERETIPWNEAKMESRL